VSAARLHLLLAALMGAAGVALLAAGSHLAGTQATTAGQMLLFHAGAVIAATAARKAALLQQTTARAGVSILIAGVVIFASDMVLRAFFEAKLFAMAAPLGGSLAILGWLVLAVSAALAPRA